MGQPLRPGERGEEGEGESGGQGEGREEGRKGGREEGSESDRKEEFNIEEERGRRRMVNKRGRQRKGERN